MARVRRDAAAAVMTTPTKFSVGARSTGRLRASRLSQREQGVLWRLRCHALKLVQDTIDVPALSRGLLGVLRFMDFLSAATIVRCLRLISEIAAGALSCLFRRYQIHVLLGTVLGFAQLPAARGLVLL